MEADGVRLRCDRMERRVLRVRRQCDIPLEKLELLRADVRKIGKGNRDGEVHAVELGELGGRRKWRRIICLEDDDDDERDKSVGSLRKYVGDLM